MRWLLQTAATPSVLWTTPTRTQLARPLTLVRRKERSPGAQRYRRRCRRNGSADGSDPCFCEYGNRTDAWHSHMRQKSRSPPRHGEEWEPFGLTSVHLSHQFGFRDATLRCWKCGGWSAGSRRASRLKNPCGFPSKTGADVVHRVSGRYPPEAHVWRSDDASGAPERIPIIKNSFYKRNRPQVLIQDDSPT